MPRVLPEHHPTGLTTWHFAALRRVGVEALTTTRAGGCSQGPYASLNLAYHVGDDPDRVTENRARLCRTLGVDRLTVPDQRHGTGVAVVDGALAGAGHASDEEARGHLGHTDALVTDRPGVALTVMMADCAPVALADPARRVVAVVHAGRRGAVRDVVGAAVGVMVARFGSTPADLVAGVGPCIGPASYEIDGPALAETRAAFGDDLLVPTDGDRARFDLPGAVVRRLEQAGVSRSRIEVAGVDTRRHTDELFSDRAARPCGRMMLVARLAG